MPLWSGVHVRVPWVEQGWPTDTANLTHNRFNFLGPWSHPLWRHAPGCWVLQVLPCRHSPPAPA
jgi:hypothetical protein